MSRSALEDFLTKFWVKLLSKITRFLEMLYFTFQHWYIFCLICFDRFFFSKVLTGLTETFVSRFLALSTFHRVYSCKMFWNTLSESLFMQFLFLTFEMLLLKAEMLTVYFLSLACLACLALFSRLIAFIAKTRIK